MGEDTIERRLEAYVKNPADETLQRKLFRYYQPFIKVAVLRSGGRWQTYEDERIEICYQLLRGLARNQITNPRVAEDYLVKVARSLTIKAEQRERRHVHESEVETVRDGTSTAAQIQARLELEELLDRLPPEDWELIRLREVEGLGFEEIAKRLGISTSEAVRKRWQRLRERLRDERQGDDGRQKP